jgi:hypothetical protein
MPPSEAGSRDRATTAGTERLDRVLPTEADTIRLGADLALALRPGDVLALGGDLGAGKTTLARALLRANAGDEALDVPSPTFTLVQHYDGRLPISHFDLYRLGSVDELEELGLEESLGEGAALIEWPERAGARLPATTVTVSIEIEGSGRRACLSGVGPVWERVSRSLAARDFLAGAGHPAAHRAGFPGDASARRYETIGPPPAPPLVLMDSPPLVLGPPVRDGKPYAVLAHTARTVAAFVGVDAALRSAGVSVPQIHAADLERGFLLLEHLGSGSFLGAGGLPVAARCAGAAELLAAIHGRDWPQDMPVAPGVVHRLPPFDRDALMIEVDLLPQWYLPWRTGAPASPEFLEAFAAAWNQVFDRLDRAEVSIVLRDFHSPNLVWRDERVGLDRLGVLDFQDALLGPSAYDVASLAMDARVSMDEPIETATVDAYVAARHATGPFDETGFREAYAICAAQRNTKILGIFVRLMRRDGKPGYIAHLPRIRAYLRRALRHPSLRPVAELYEGHGLLSEAS